MSIGALQGRNGEESLRLRWREAAKKYVGDAPKPTVDDAARYYRERNIAAVVFTVDVESGPIHKYSRAVA